MSDRKKIILWTISDAVSKILYYDRKEDENLPVNAIEESIKSGEVTIDEMVECFRVALIEAGLEHGA